MSTMGSLTPNFTRLHDPYCNCFECGTNSVDGIINVLPVDHLDALNSQLQGKFIHTSTPLKIYTKPDGVNIRRTVQPDKYIGKVESVNATTGWITINNGLGFIRYSKDLSFSTPNPNAPPLTKNQLVQVELGTLEQIPGGEVITLGKDLSQVSNSIINFDWIGNFKWILIGIVVILILIVVIKVT